MTNYSDTVSSTNVTIKQGYESTQLSDMSMGTFYLGCGLSILPGLTNVVLVILQKRYADFFSDTQKQVSVLFWTFFSGTLLSILLMFCFETPVLPDSIMDYLLSFGHVVCYVIILPTIIYACLVIDGNTVNILLTSSIVYMVIAQYTVLKDIHPGHRNWIEIAGIVLVIFGSALSSIKQLLKPAN